MYMSLHEQRVSSDSPFSFAIEHFENVCNYETKIFLFYFNFFFTHLLQKDLFTFLLIKVNAKTIHITISSYFVNLLVQSLRDFIQFVRKFHDKNSKN